MSPGLAPPRIWDRRSGVRDCSGYCQAWEFCGCYLALKEVTDEALRTYDAFWIFLISGFFLATWDALSQQSPTPGLVREPSREPNRISILVQLQHKVESRLFRAASRFSDLAALMENIHTKHLAAFTDASGEFLNSAGAEICNNKLECS